MSPCLRTNGGKPLWSVGHLDAFPLPLCPISSHFLVLRRVEALGGTSGRRCVSAGFRGLRFSTLLPCPACLTAPTFCRMALTQDSSLPPNGPRSQLPELVAELRTGPEEGSEAVASGEWWKEPS